MARVSRAPNVISTEGKAGPVPKQQSAEAARTLPDHDQCETHQKYKLSCEQYERLLARAGQLCEICRKSVQHTQSGKLNIDHCGPWWGVRGLLCTPCNTKLRDGAAWLPGAAEYLANTWWLQECRRLGLPSALGDEPEIGTAIRDQYATVWIRYADGGWRPHGGRTSGGIHTWERIYEMRGPQNMVPFDVRGPGGSDLLRWYVDRARHADALERAEAAAHERGRLEFARELLASVSDEERSYYLKMADLSEYEEDWEEGDEPRQTEADLACSAIDSLLNSVRCDWDYLAGRVGDALREMPGGIGERSLAHGAKKPTHLGGPYARTFVLSDALYVAGDLLDLPAAREFLGAMPEGERSEWMTFARSLNELAELDEDVLTTRAARCARVVLDNRNWDSMCTGPGIAIPSCPQRATHVARLAESVCCGPDGPKDHKGHRVCDGHLAELIAGESAGKSGKAFSTTDYQPIGAAAWDF